MPESHTGPYCHLNGRTSQLEQFMAGTTPSEYHTLSRRHTGLAVKKETSFDPLSSSPDAKGCRADRGSILNADIGTKARFQGQTSKKSRAKEGSKHFGVRFRPDLQKWVAEIRVAEWKTVDKKVWLGTFETEEGAARAVDAARKLLKCKKKRAPNFPCESLSAYSEKIPPSLNLTNLRDDSEVTLFVKRKARICTSPKTFISITADQIFAEYNSLLSEPSEELALQDDNISMTSYVRTSYGSSYGSHNTHLGVMSGGARWMSPPTSVAYYSSSAGSSPDDQRGLYLDNLSNIYPQAEMPQIVEQCVDGEWTAVEEPRGTVWDGHMNMGSDGQTYGSDQWLINDFLFPNDIEFFRYQTSDMDIVPDEMTYMENQNQAFSIGDALPLLQQITNVPALEDLHTLCTPRIIHHDIKSSNILLTKQFVAKLADFGLSKTRQEDENQTHISTVVKGTIGYLDPEYYKPGQLNEKIDVYSFGVLVLEIISLRNSFEKIVAGFFHHTNGDEVKISRGERCCEERNEIPGFVAEIFPLMTLKEISLLVTSDSRDELPQKPSGIDTLRMKNRREFLQAPLSQESRDGMCRSLLPDDEKETKRLRNEKLMTSLTQFFRHTIEAAIEPILGPVAALLQSHGEAQLKQQEQILGIQTKKLIVRTQKLQLIKRRRGGRRHPPRRKAAFAKSNSSRLRIRRAGASTQVPSDAMRFCPFSVWNV